MRQTVGDREMIGFVRRFAQVEEVARAQEGFVSGQQGVVKRLLPIEAGLDEPIVLPKGVLVDRFAGGLAHEIPKQGLCIGDLDMFGEENTIGGSRRACRRQRANDLHPLESYARLPSDGKRRIAISGRTPFHVAGKRYG